MLYFVTMITVSVSFQNVSTIIFDPKQLRCF